mmetsp:Transcript_19969/g.56115  ORF Transcript_19969/g.56115 Transcript_19969/m.56115 type:complete len:95 (+) Transcript_19969:151-435(+)|eukprot:CAMPEP_0119137612 /NCGR_PEP_ID=MMETSP1310-20130426/23979_1 /TAXON_ID=464262 /ORGANISM="Genus nov. species nov., Strain RCC2339" /LENGTH=94 /DNA_ID=CAMNT_0007128719 /DNA_START=89 /DNA_END=373 /DNA_ORIENTATION=-
MVLDKADAENAVYWGKQAVSLVLGIVWGIIPLEGGPAMIAYLLLVHAAVFGYVKSKGIGEECFENGYSDILKEGLMPALATFLVAWIFTYNLRV